MVCLPRGSYYHTVVGNILGDSSWTPSVYANSAGEGGDISGIYILGFPNGTSTSLTPEQTWSTFPGSLPDAAVASTLLRHGNYDYHSAATVWDSGITSHAIPDSLFYSSKPSLFGSLAWPAIGPDLGTMVNPTPARSRWLTYQGSGTLADLFADQA
jgi:hypothetical protein